MGELEQQVLELELEVRDMRDYEGKSLLTEEFWVGKPRPEGQMRPVKPLIWPTKLE